MKLELGMYCFDKTNRKQGIGKIISFQRNNNVNIKYKNDIELVSNGNIKASHNVMDLLELGDYVNGAMIVMIKIDENGTKWVYTNNKNDYGYKSKEIQTIVTKAQMESISYKVEQ